MKNFLSLKYPLCLSFDELKLVILFGYSAAMEVNEAMKVDAKTNFYRCPKKHFTA